MVMQACVCMCMEASACMHTAGMKSIIPGAQIRILKLRRGNNSVQPFQFRLKLNTSIAGEPWLTFHIDPSCNSNKISGGK